MTTTETAVTAPETDSAIRVPPELFPQVRDFVVAHGYDMLAHPRADGQIPRYTASHTALGRRQKNVTLVAAGLTDREHQVLQRMALGKTNGDIGRELHLSEDTVKTHARRLFRTLGARDRANAVAIGYQRGILR